MIKIFVIPNFFSSCIFLCKITTAIIINTTRATKHIINKTLTAGSPLVLPVEELATVGVHCVYESEVEARQGHKYQLAYVIYFDHSGIDNSPHNNQ